MTKAEKLRRQIKSGQQLRAYSNEDMAIKLHMSLSQYNRRLSNPDKITFYELTRLEQILKVPLLSDQLA